MRLSTSTLKCTSEVDEILLPLFLYLLRPKLLPFISPSPVSSFLIFRLIYCHLGPPRPSPPNGRHLSAVLWLSPLISTLDLRPERHPMATCLCNFQFANLTSSLSSHWVTFGFWLMRKYQSVTQFRNLKWEGGKATCSDSSLTEYLQILREREHELCLEEKGNHFHLKENDDDDDVA